MRILGPNLVRNFRAPADCNLKMMCDVSATRLNTLQALYPDVAAETNFEHMLNGVGLDALAVATSVKLHFPMAKAALSAGKHVLIEKPMAASAAQCEELIEIARKNGVVLMSPLEKIRIFDARVERPPHYDTFAEFQYAYHYGDVLSPFLKHKKPLEAECFHFLEFIRESRRPLTCGVRGVELVKILEAFSASLKLLGRAVPLFPSERTLSAQTQTHRRATGADDVLKVRSKRFPAVSSQPRR
ncbi:MAG TPA: Gfo/Idh/MocA family oxidoreductase [Candidatus Baltobacteraceae bacterium]|jgi:hypothetical protein|nr:Gfo/Idh/MocA family oxidoreductase [Candidatus Baltobacteraceae bacterium]